MTRAIVLICTVLLCSGFTWPPDFAERSRADVCTCVMFARRVSPTFEARVRGIDLQTGHVDIERSAEDTRGERAFTRCLLVVRHWWLIERNLPKPTDPVGPDPATMASASGSVTR